METGKGLAGCGIGDKDKNFIYRNRTERSLRMDRFSASDGIFYRWMPRKWTSTAEVETSCSVW
jgi:hypothetical protein